jgi:branched-subunit amino acid transport protein
MTIWLIMIALAVGTFLIRISFILLLSNRDVPPLLSSALRFVPPAVLTALVVPQILNRTNTMEISFANPQLVAGIVAVLVAWRTRNVLLTILGGMAVLWILQALRVGS